MCIPPKLLEVLDIVSKVLTGISARWVLVGSTASSLNGIEVEPKDIDIIVETNKVYEVDKALASSFRALRRVKYSSNGTYSSHYGVFEVLGVKVEVMADLKICGEPGCLEVEFEDLYQHSKDLRIGDKSLKVAPLEWQLIANTIIPGKEERVARILKALKTKGADIRVMDSILSNTPPSIKRQVSELLNDTHNTQ